MPEGDKSATQAARKATGLNRLESVKYISPPGTWTAEAISASTPRPPKTSPMEKAANAARQAERRALDG
jgi:hypothetical protein